MSKVKTQVYFCGGCGMDIGPLVNHADVAYIDTCDKNLTEKHDVSKVFLTEGTRGAGANRRFILPLVRPQIKPFLERFPAGQANIVVFGGGGGSGSTTGPLIVAELLKQGETVFVVVINGIGSTEYIQNDIDTLKTLEGISSNVQGNVVFIPVDCAPGVPFSVVDAEAAFNIHAILNLTSQRNARLDVMDVHNFVNFQHRIPGFIPQLCVMSIHTSRQEAASVQEMLAVASLYTDAAKEVPFGSPFVHQVGISNPHDPELVADQLHFVISTNGVQDVMKALDDMKQEQARIQARYSQRRAIIDVDDNRTEDGFVC